MLQSTVCSSSYFKQLKKYLPYYHLSSEFYHEIADRVLDRMPLMKFTPESIMVVGSADGYLALQLHKLYPEAKIIAVEVSMIWFETFADTYQKIGCEQVVTSYDSLPFESYSIDCVICNLSLSWVNNFCDVLQEWYRVLSQEAVLLFSCLGVDSLVQCKESFLSVNETNRVHEFSDMHLVGDELLSVGYVDPVMHMENISIDYNSLDNLWRDLRNAVGVNVRQDRPKGLLSPSKWKQFLNCYESYKTSDSRFPVNLEIIYGHALGKGGVKMPSRNQEGLIEVPLEMLRSQLKNGL